MKNPVKIIKKNLVLTKDSDAEAKQSLMLPIKKGVIVEKIASWITEKRENQELEVSQLQKKVFGNSVFSSSPG